LPGVTTRLARLGILGADDDELTGLERPVDRPDLDVAVGGQARLHDEVLERAVLLDLDPRRPVRRERERADGDCDDGALGRLDRDREPQREALERRRRLVDADLEVDVVRACSSISTRMPGLTSGAASRGRDESIAS
jgi:hypothetical protein